MYGSLFAIVQLPSIYYTFLKLPITVPNIEDFRCRRYDNERKSIINKINNFSHIDLKTVILATLSIMFIYSTPIRKPCVVYVNKLTVRPCLYIFAPLHCTGRKFPLRRNLIKSTCQYYHFTLNLSCQIFASLSLESVEGVEKTSTFVGGRIKYKQYCFII